MPTTTAERITNLDTVRGIATLLILVMNVVGIAHPAGVYYNLDAGGSENALDWAIGVFGEIFVDQKAMALFSMLFGAGIVLFAERVSAKGRNPVGLSLWRNFLLFAIGILHFAIWEGDVLTVYAICAPVVLAMRNRSPRTAITAGAVLYVGAALVSFLAQVTLDDPRDLGELFFNTEQLPSDLALTVLIADGFLRALGAMLIGVGLYRSRVLHGQEPVELYRRFVVWGLGIGLPLTTLGTVIQFADGWDGELSYLGAGVNTVGTIPVAMGYLGLITLWDHRPATAAHGRVRAVGRMALTNYLTQTIIGLIVLRGVFEFGSLNRTALFVFVLAVWVVQLAWSKPWLDRFRFGPFEWFWRTATYRHVQPMRK